MNDKILDDAFYKPSHLEKILREDESVLWEGSPSWKYRSTIFDGHKKKKIYLIVGLSLLFISFGYCTFVNESINLWGFILIGLVFFILLEYDFYKNKKNLVISITKDRVIFNYRNSPPFKMISFWDIDTYSIIEHNKEVKTFVLVPIPKKLESYNFKHPNGKSFSGVMLELIDDYEIVEVLLQIGIKKYKRLRKNE